MRRENTAKSQSKQNLNREALSRWVNENARTTLEQEASRGGDGYVSAQGGCLQDTL